MLLVRDCQVCMCHESQYCTCICILQGNYLTIDCVNTNSMTQIIKCDWVLWSGTFMGSMLKKQTPPSFCLVMKLGVTIADVWTLRKTATGLQKISCWHMKCHNVTWLVCGLHWQRHWLFTLICDTHSDNIFEHLFIYKRQCNCSHGKQLRVLFVECFWWQNNKQENVASLFTRSEHTWILHVGHVTG